MFDANTGEMLRTLDPTDIAAGDGYAESVAVYGTTAVVGADSKNDDNGQAYVFDVTTGTELRKLVPTTPGAQLGQSVGINENFIYAGAEGDDSGRGAGYIYDRATYQLRTKLVFDDPDANSQGNKGALSGNSVLMVGDNPAAYVFDAVTGSLSQKLTVSGAEGLGSYGALSGTLAVVGDNDDSEDRGAAYVFDATTGAILHVLRAADGEADDKFGDCVAIDGHTVAVGATGDENGSGSVYVFDALTGIQLIRIRPDDSTSGAEFGLSLSISNGRLLVGAPTGFADDGDGGQAQSGVAYLFNLDPQALADVNADGQVDVLDIDQLSTAVRNGSKEPQYDLNHDEEVSSFDREVWIRALQHTYVGDANLDGAFDSSDFVEVFSVGKYETGQAAGWSEGDWNGDALFNSNDFVAAFAGGGYELGPMAAAQAVPEPNSLLAASIMALGSLFVWRRRRGN